MKLKDYYRNTVNLNDSGTGGWAPLYYGIFSKVIEEYNYKNIAEIGIGYGTHAKHILKNNININHLFLIDPIQYYPNDNFVTDIMANETEEGDHFNELKNLIVEELKPWESKYTLFRKNSLDVLNTEIPNDSLDIVFIDGAHDYFNVKADLEFWTKKVRSGGQILGDDIWIESVKNAVEDFSKETCKNYDLLTLPNNDYKIYRFFK
jgi:hypothetical protein